jgi:hypothetical protein
MHSRQATLEDIRDSLTLGLTQHSKTSVTDPRLEVHVIPTSSSSTSHHGTQHHSMQPGMPASCSVPPAASRITLSLLYGKTTCDWMQCGRLAVCTPSDRTTASRVISSACSSTLGQASIELGVSCSRRHLLHLLQSPPHRRTCRTQGAQPRPATCMPCMCPPCRPHPTGAVHAACMPCIHRTAPAPLRATTAHAAHLAASVCMCAMRAHVPLRHADDARCHELLQFARNARIPQVLAERAGRFLALFKHLLHDGVHHDVLDLHTQPACRQHT